MLGKLSWAAIPFDQPIPLFTAALVGVAIIGVLIWVTLKGWLPYLWHEWITRDRQIDCWASAVKGARSKAGQARMSNLQCYATRGAQ